MIELKELQTIVGHAVTNVRFSFVIQIIIIFVF
jgi:hypothetical protein